MALVMRLLPPLKQLSQVPTTAQQSLAAAERLFEVLDQPTESAARPRHAHGATLERAIEFENVTLRVRRRRRCSSDVTFVARRGEVVALVGASGAGKSTLVDLIPRFYEPTSGRITLDGVDTARDHAASLRALTGIVSQDTVLFNDTVRNNIAYGAPDRFTDEQIEAAARAANAHAFITELPRRLRHGARRARHAALRRPAPAPRHRARPARRSADPHSRRSDLRARHRVGATRAGSDRSAARGRTVFVIAHRLSTVVHATQILVLDRGRIVERGTHAELLARRGAYHRLHALQFPRGGEAA